jgi:hypothetical protein
MTTQQVSPPASIPGRAPERTRRGWLIAAGLILLSLVPIAAGVMRVTELAVGAEITEGNARFFDSPVPVIAHIFGATVFCVLGAFQFVPGLRRGRPSWHRIAGRILVPAGLIAASTGMWMAVFYPRPLLDTIVRLVFGALMFACIVVAFRAVRRREFGAHRAWMIRGYAIGIGAGTQVLTALVWLALAGGADPGPTGTVALLAAAWVINLAVAEFAIRRGARAARSASAVRTVST